MRDSETQGRWPRISDAAQKLHAVSYPDEEMDWEALWCRPVIDSTAWVSPGAVVLGRVSLKARSSIWYGCILRGDGAFIEVGEETNIQDGSILHTEPEVPCIIKSRVTLGHRAIVHASVVEDNAMIGIGATVLSRCVIGQGALIAAGALVLEGTSVPPGTLWAGVPARQVKELTSVQRERLALTYRHYVNLGYMYLKRFGREHIDALQMGGIP